VRLIPDVHSALWSRTHTPANLENIIFVIPEQTRPKYAQCILQGDELVAPARVDVIRGGAMAAATSITILL
jgi:hypothetical protein